MTCNKTQIPTKTEKATAAGYGDGENQDLVVMERVCQFIVKCDRPEPPVLSGICAEMVRIEMTGDNTEKKGISRATDEAPAKSHP